MNTRMRTIDIPVCSLRFQKSKSNSLKQVFLSVILAHFRGKSTVIIRQGCSNELLCLIFTRLSLQKIRQYVSNWRNCLTLGFSHSSQIQPVADPGNNGAQTAFNAFMRKPFAPCPLPFTICPLQFVIDTLLCECYNFSVRCDFFTLTPRRQNRIHKLRGSVLYNIKEVFQWQHL